MTMQWFIAEKTCFMKQLYDVLAVLSDLEYEL